MSSSFTLLPSSFLPPIRRKPSFQAVKDALSSLKSFNRSQLLAGQDENDEDMQHPHERDYALSWLNRLIDSNLDWLADDEDAKPGSGSSGSTSITLLLDQAANLLEQMVKAETQEQGLEDDEPMERFFTFPFNFDKPTESQRSQKGREGGSSAGQDLLTVKLLDEPLPPSGSDKDPTTIAGEAADGSVIPASLEASTAVGVQTWAAAIVLSDLLVCSPHEVHCGLPDRSSTSSNGVQPLEVAELGAGTGLVGIVCAKLLQERSQALSTAHQDEAPSSVVLTDYHPRVLDNLRRNVEANFTAHLSESVEVQSLDWSHYHPFSSERDKGTYDLLLAADVVYAQEHATWLYSAMQALLSRHKESRAHVVNAKRMQGRFGEWELVKGTDDAFGPLWQQEEPAPSSSTQQSLRVIRRVEMPKRKGLGRSDESGHVWWTLAWR